jgi:hypothetical protein
MGDRFLYGAVTASGALVLFLTWRFGYRLARGSQPEGTMSEPVEAPRSRRRLALVS